jgi:membrane protein implicated in regulation of membrane protease activity
MSSFTLYVFGSIILIAGLAWGASLLGVAPTWIGVGVVVLAGLAIISGVKRARRPDPPPPA